MTDDMAGKFLLYHQTDSELVAAILAEGLKPNASRLRDGRLAAPAVYLASHADWFAGDPFGAALLEVDASQLDPDYQHEHGARHFTPGMSRDNGCAGVAVRYRGPIPAASIRVLYAD